MGMLTVEENIAFSAALRMSPIITQKVRLARVKEIIDDLGLGKCAKKKVSNLSLPPSIC